MRSEEGKDATVELYARTLNEVEALASAAARRGDHATLGLQSNPKRNDIRQSPGNVNADNAIKELISQISRESNQPPKQDLSPGHTDLDDNLDESSNKKQRVFESEMPWANHEDEAR